MLQCHGISPLSSAVVRANLALLDVATVGVSQVPRAEPAKVLPTPWSSWPGLFHLRGVHRPTAMFYRFIRVSSSTGCTRS